MDLTLDELDSPRHPEGKPQGADELTILQLLQRLEEAGFVTGRHLVDGAIRTGVLPVRFAPLGRRVHRVIRWDDGLAFAQARMPQVVSGQTFRFGLMDSELTAHVERLHRLAERSTQAPQGALPLAHGQAGVLLLATHREHPYGWEDAGCSYTPIRPGAIDETIRLFQEAIDRGDDPVLLPVLFDAGKPITALGVLVSAPDPAFIDRLPIPPTEIIEHEDRIEARYLLRRAIPIQRVGALSRMLRVSGVSVFP